MLELRLSGIHDDGEHLVLESVQGERYILPIDQNLRTSIAKARRIQPLRGRPGNGVFGPRDIQARFRQGASVEQIVEESGWEAERVRRYEWPILAERAHIIAAARAVRISPAVLSHGRSDAPALSLDELMERVGEKFNLPLEDAQWSTYQQESGQWSISADIELSEQAQQRIPQTVVFPARWTYNPANQSVYASNEAAYFLMERADQEDAPVPGMMSHAHQHEEDTPASVEEPVQTSTDSVAELSEISASTPKVAPLSEKPQSVEGAGTRDFASASERKLAELLERARNSSAQKVTVVADSVVSSTDSVPQNVQDQPQANDEVATTEQQSVQKNIESQDVSAMSSDSADIEQQQDSADEVSADSSRTESPETPAKAESSSSRSKRTSVPSWDDIIFGNQRR